MTNIIARLLCSNHYESAHDLAQRCLDAGEALQLAAEDNSNLLARVEEFDRCINRIATELGGVCCGGVDGDQSDPGSTSAVLVAAIRKLKGIQVERKPWEPFMAVQATMVNGVPYVEARYLQECVAEIARLNKVC